MSQRRFPLVSIEGLTQLKTSLLYCKMTELKRFLLNLGLPDKGKKNDLIQRIVTYLKTGEVTTLPKIPSISKAQRGKTYPIAPETKILKGSYKNDLATRTFFKSLIGPHFHFTAFGVDWINERWLAGNPPTYKEYAEMWIAETKKRQTLRANPKEEWAYINFVQNYLIEHPKSNKQELLEAWKQEQESHFTRVCKIISYISAQ